MNNLFILSLLLYLLIPSCSEIEETGQFSETIIKLQKNELSDASLKQLVNDRENNSIINIALIPFSKIEHLQIEGDIEVKTLLDIKESIWYLDYENAIEKIHYLKEIFKKSTNSHKNVLELICFDLELSLYSQENRRRTRLIEILKKIEHQNFSEIALIEKYFFLNALNHKLNFLRNESRISEALATCDYALHLIYSNKLEDKFPAIIAEFLLDKGIIHSLENEIFYHSAMDHFLKAEAIFGKYNLVDRKTFSEINKANLLLQMKDSISAFEIYEQADNQNLSPFLKMYLNINLGFFYMNKNSPHNAKACFNSALQMLDTLNCSKFKSILELYLSDIYLLEGNIDSSKHYLSQANNLESCDPFLKNLINFYSIQTEQAIQKQQLRKEDNLNYLNNFFNLYDLERALSDSLFGDAQALHLDHYYTQNTSKYLKELLEFNTILPIETRSKLWKLIDDTKIRELKTDIVKYNMENSAIKKRIKYYKNLIKDHTASSGFDKLVYDSIYMLYKFQNLDLVANKKINNVRVSETNRDYALLNEFLIKNNACIIESLIYADQYFFIYDNGFEMDISAYDKNMLESNIMKAFNKINQISDTLELSQIKVLLFQNGISNSKNIFFLPDGILSSFPIQLCLNRDQNMFFPISVFDICNELNSTLDLDESSIFCYTNSTTFNSGIISDYIELYGAYAESLELNKILSGSQLFAGESCTTSNLKKSLNKNILHIATHSTMDSTSRLGGSLILRNENGEPINFFPIELLSSEHNLTFVSLSSCSTAQGIHLTGTGTYSVARTFLELGTQTVLKTLWKIDDQASKEFMISFYTNWKSGISVSDALKKTKLEFQNSDGSYTHPYYWAGFVLEGNPNLFLKKEDS